MFFSFFLSVAADPWDTASQLEHVPVRFHVRGNKYDSDTEKHGIERTYEFYHFRTGLPPDQEIWEVSNHGTECLKIDATH